MYFGPTAVFSMKKPILSALNCSLHCQANRNCVVAEDGSDEEEEAEEDN